MQPPPISRELERRLAALERIYAVFSEFIASFDLACEHGCAACCTGNMTLTTLEGYRIIAGMDAAGRHALFATVLAASGQQRFQPATTNNTIAQLCRDGKPVPAEAADPSWGVCPLLRDAACPVYTRRPFGCRCMVSRKDCRLTGFADADELIVTVSNLILQHIEHIDSFGAFGNLIDILIAFSDPATLDAYRRQHRLPKIKGLLPNRPIPVLMVPPEHRQQAQAILKQLR